MGREIFMILIKDVAISNFRSIKELSLTNLGNLTSLAGINNCGKSNIVKALNLFFLGEVDPGNGLVMSRDYYRHEEKRKKKKKIRVTVTFTKPGNFNFRKGLESAEELFNHGNEIQVSKEWEPCSIRPQYYLNHEPLPVGPTDVQRIDQFLNLISFRYIPNRVEPISVIREQDATLREALVRRISRGSKKAPKPDELIRTIGSASTKLINEMSAHFKRSCPDIDNVRLSTPEALGEMIFNLGFQLSERGAEFEDTLQGSGIQSLLMFETLSLIDRDYYQQFGWRQASIWAVEEPESSLNLALESQVALYLSDISNEPSSRLQIIATTHSDLMMQYSDKTFVIKKPPAGIGTQADTINDLRNLISLTAAEGISRWCDPLLMFPHEPAILVEGKFDRDFLNEGFRLLGHDNTVRVVFFEDEWQGKDALRKYVRERKNALKSRSNDAPIILIVDWEDKGGAKDLENIFLKADSLKVLKWPEKDCNPRLNQSFKGIERYYSDRMILEAEKLGTEIARTAQGNCQIVSENKDSFKQKANEVVQMGLKKKDLEFAGAFLCQILKAAGVLQE
jgi:hypothetical protein